MPRYEMALILKAMHRPETVATLKCTMEALFENGAIIRNLESSGKNNLPYKISKHSQCHTRGGYFLVVFYAPPTLIPSMLDHVSHDIDIIRPTILKHEEEKRPEKPCQEMEPPTNLAGPGSGSDPTTHT